MILDANGTPNSGGNEVGIYLTAASYKFQLKSAGGVNCISGSTIWTADNISATAFLNIANTWTALQTFSAGIVTTTTVSTGAGTHTGNETFSTFNNEIYVDGTKYACSAAGIHSALVDASVTTVGGIAHIGSNCNGMSIATNLWAGITNPTKVIWEPTVTFTAQQILPSNTELAGSGWQTVLTIGASANWAAPEALFVNAAYLTYGTSSGHDTGISIHDFFVDGSANTLSTEVVGFRGADNSQIYNLYMKNISHNAIDIRDGTANDVHDNWCVGCGTFGAPYHAIGGGIFAATGIFLHNKFTRNHVSGGGASTDHFDIFGQGAGVRCGFNVFAENTSDASPSQAFFLDTCNNNTLTGNIARNALQQGFAVTTGTANLDGGAVRNTFAGNIVNNSAAACYFFSNNSNNNSVSGGSCILSAKDGVLIQDSSYNEVTGVEISGPGQLLAATYSGVKITNGSATAQASNFIHNNLIQDLNAKMQFGVNVLPAAGGTQTSNNVHDNFILGGAAGSVGNGVQDTGTTTVEYGDQYGSASAFFNFYGMANVRPGADNTTPLGGSGFRWSDLWLGGNIRTPNLLISSTAPTIAAGGCGGAAASIPNNNGTSAFTVNVGTTPTAACTITLPAATTGWACFATDITTKTTAVFVQAQTGGSTTSATITNYNDVAVAANFTASDILRMSCTAY